MVETNLLKIVTNDKKMFEIDVKIKNLVKIFNEICEDYDIKEVVNLDKINSVSFEKVLRFCEQIEYTPFVIDAKWKSNSQLINELNKNARIYYDSIKLEEVEELINLADYLSIKCLYDICSLKLADFLSSKGSLDQSIDVKYTSISKEREKELREKYIKDQSYDDATIAEALIYGLQDG